MWHIPSHSLTSRLAPSSLPTITNSHFSSKWRSYYVQGAYFIVAGNSCFLGLLGRPWFPTPWTGSRSGMLLLLRVGTIRRQIRNVAEVILHLLLKFDDFMIQDFLKLRGVELWLSVAISQLLDLVDRLSILASNQACLWESLPWARHFHCWLFLVDQRSLNMWNLRSWLRDVWLTSWPWDFLAFFIDAHQDFLIQHDLLLQKVFGLHLVGLVVMTSVRNLDFLWCLVFGHWQLRPVELRPWVFWLFPIFRWFWRQLVSFLRAWVSW